MVGDLAVEHDAGVGRHHGLLPRQLDLDARSGSQRSLVPELNLTEAGLVADQDLVPSAAATFHDVECRELAVVQTVPAREPSYLGIVLDADAGRDGYPGSRREGRPDIGLTPCVAGQHEAGPTELGRQLLAEAHSGGVFPYTGVADVLGLEFEVPGQCHGSEANRDQGNDELLHFFFL